MCVNTRNVFSKTRPGANDFFLGSYASVWVRADSTLKLDRGGALGLCLSSAAWRFDVFSGAWGSRVEHLRRRRPWGPSSRITSFNLMSALCKERQQNVQVKSRKQTVLCETTFGGQRTTKAEKDQQIIRCGIQAIAIIRVAKWRPPIRKHERCVLEAALAAQAR